MGKESIHLHLSKSQTLFYFITFLENINNWFVILKDLILLKLIAT